MFQNMTLFYRMEDRKRPKVKHNYEHARERQCNMAIRSELLQYVFFNSR